jgi:hypothetical protein
MPFDDRSTIKLRGPRHIYIIYYITTFHIYLTYLHIRLHFIWRWHGIIY